MIFSQFSIGQQVRHKLFGYLGVIIDVDPEYSPDQIFIHEIYLYNIYTKSYPWYHVIMEDKEGKPVHTYLSENQLSNEMLIHHPDQSGLDELAEYISIQLKTLKLKN